MGRKSVLKADKRAEKKAAKEKTEEDDDEKGTMCTPDSIRQPPETITIAKTSTGVRQRDNSLSGGSSVDEMEVGLEGPFEFPSTIASDRYLLLKPNVIQRYQAETLQQSLTDKTSALMVGVWRARDVKSNDVASEGYEKVSRLGGTLSLYNTVLPYCTYDSPKNMADWNKPLNEIDIKIPPIMAKIAFAKMDYMFTQYLLGKKINVSGPYAKELLDHIKFIFKAVNFNAFVDLEGIAFEARLTLLDFGVANYNNDLRSAKKKILRAVNLAQTMVKESCKFDKSTQLKAKYLQNKVAITYNAFRTKFNENREEKNNLIEFNSSGDERDSLIVSCKVSEDAHASDAIFLSEMPGMIGGMHAVCKLSPGQPLFQEQAKYACLTRYEDVDHKQQSTCFECMKRTWLLYPCPKCSMCMFCSFECLKKGHLVYDCDIAFIPRAMQMLKLRENMKFESECFVEIAAVVLRILCRNPLSLWKSKVNAIPICLPLTMGRVGIDSINMLELSFRTWRTLRVKIYPRLHRKFLEYSIYLLNLLRQAGYFGDDRIDSFCEDKFKYNIPSKLTAVEYLMANTIYKLFCIVNAYNFPVKEMTCRNSITCVSFEEACYTTTAIKGRCFMPLLGTIGKHSCDPNAVLICSGSNAYVYCIRLIEPGQTITISYGLRNPHNSLRQRNLFHRIRFGRKCGCVACVAKLSMDTRGYPNGTIHPDHELYSTADDYDKLTTEHLYSDAMQIFKDGCRKIEGHVAAGIRIADYITALMSQLRLMAYTIKYSDLESNSSFFDLGCQMVEAVNTFVKYSHISEIKLVCALRFTLEVSHLCPDSVSKPQFEYPTTSDPLNKDSALTRLVIVPFILKRKSFQSFLMCRQFTVDDQFAVIAKTMQSTFEMMNEITLGNDRSFNNEAKALKEERPMNKVMLDFCLDQRKKVYPTMDTTVSIVNKGDSSKACKGQVKFQIPAETAENLKKELCIRRDTTLTSEELEILNYDYLA